MAPNLYSGKYEGMPILPISLFNYDGEILISNHESLLDTGASAIVATESELMRLEVDMNKLGMPSTLEPVPVELADGRHLLADTYIVKVKIGDKIFNTPLLVITSKIWPIFMPGKDQIKTGMCVFEDNNLVITVNTRSNELTISQ